MKQFGLRFIVISMDPDRSAVCGLRAGWFSTTAVPAI